MRQERVTRSPSLTVEERRWSVIFGGLSVLFAPPAPLSPPIAAAHTPISNREMRSISRRLQKTHFTRTVPHRGHVLDMMSSLEMGPSNFGFFFPNTTAMNIPREWDSSPISTLNLNTNDLAIIFNMAASKKRRNPETNRNLLLVLGLVSVLNDSCCVSNDATERVNEE